MQNELGVGKGRKMKMYEERGGMRRMRRHE